ISDGFPRDTTVVGNPSLIYIITDDFPTTFRHASQTLATCESSQTFTTGESTQLLASIRFKMQQASLHVNETGESNGYSAESYFVNVQASHMSRQVYALYNTRRVFALLRYEITTTVMHSAALICANVGRDDKTVARVEIKTQVQVQQQVERQVQEHMRQRELEANAREEARERENYSDWLLTETSPTDFRRILLSLFPTEFQQMTITDQESQTDLFRHKSVGNCH
ncbi:hypothetical protein Tco_0826554, partial [Tanacetum coccineum]